MQRMQYQYLQLSGPDMTWKINKYLVLWCCGENSKLKRGKYKVFSLIFAVIISLSLPPTTAFVVGTLLILLSISNSANCRKHNLINLVSVYVESLASMSSTIYINTWCTNYYLNSEIIFKQTLAYDNKRNILLRI